MKRNFVLFAMALVVMTSLLLSQGDDWKFSGQFQIRTELDGRDFSNLTYPLSFTSMRTRFGVEKILSSKISAFVQIQDSRVWGDSKASIANSKNLDLHQGFVQFNGLFDVPLNLKAGRFEMQYRNGRIFASNQFNYISRSWDGMRLSYDTKPFSIDAFALTGVNSINYIGSASSALSQYPYPSIPDQGQNIYGVWSTFTFDQDHYFDVFAYYDWNRAKTSNGNNLSNRYLAGFQYKIAMDKFTTLLEAAYQGGEAGDQAISTDPMKVAAYNVALGVDYAFDDFKIGLHGDIMSGTSTEELAKGETNNTYDGSYQTKHAFYGSMDYFSNLKTSTGNRGLNDFFLSCEYAPKGSQFAMSIDAHQFMTNQSYVLQNGDESSALGQEVDLSVKYTIMKGSTLEWVGSVFLPGDVSKDIYDIDRTDGTKYDREDPAFSTFLMLRIGF